MSIKLRPYQKESSNECLNQLNEGKNVIYQLPTGGGKTVIIDDIVKKVLRGKAKFTTKKILILIHRREIIFQMYNRLVESGIDAGYLVGMKKKNTDATVLIGSIQTITRDKRLEKILQEEYNFVVIDEVHHARSGSYDKVLTTLKEKNPDMRLLGVTATPNRHDGKELIEHFDVMVKGPSIATLQDGGYLANSITYLADLTDLEDEVDSSNADYKIGELSAYMRNPDVIKQAINLYKEKADGKQMLVFCVDKTHLHEAEKAYNEEGYDNTAHIVAETSSSERARIIDEYKKGNIDIIFSIETLTEGTDLPDTKVIQLLRPTKSQELYLQIVGRGLRPKSDGSKLIILDIANCSKEHGLCDSNRTWSLDSKKMKLERDGKIIVGKRADGTYTDDIEEITVDFLDVEEMTREEFIMKSANGIEVAENSNKRIKEEVAKLINEASEKIVKMLPGKWVAKKFEGDDVDKDMTYNNLKFLSEGSKNDAITLKLVEKNEAYEVTLKEDRYSWSSKYEQMDWWVILGSVVPAVRKKQVKEVLKKLFKDADKKFEGIVNVGQIKTKMQEAKREQVLVKINHCLENGIHEFDFDNTFYADDYNRNFWRGDKLTFTDPRPRLKNSQKVRFGGTEGNLKREDIVTMFMTEGVIWPELVK